MLFYPFQNDPEARGHWRSSSASKTNQSKTNWVERGGIAQRAATHR